MASEIKPLPDPESGATYAGVGEKLPLGIKLAYGMPNFAGAAMVIPIAIHMNLFYSDTVLALTSGLYHLLRLRAAFRMRSQPVAAGTVDSHVEVTESLRQIQRAA